MQNTKVTFFVILLISLFTVSTALLAQTKATWDSKEISENGSIVVIEHTSGVCTVFEKRDGSLIVNAITHYGDDEATVNVAITKEGYRAYGSTKKKRADKGTSELIYPEQAEKLLLENCQEKIPSLPVRVRLKMGGWQGQPSTDEIKEEIERIIRQYNYAELAWSINPEFLDAEKKFMLFSVEGGEAQRTVLARITRYRKGGYHLQSASSHEVKIVSIELDHTRTKAKVVTSETAYWVNTRGDTYNQLNKPHTYSMELIDGWWKIWRDDFEL